MVMGDQPAGFHTTSLAFISCCEEQAWRPCLGSSSLDAAHRWAMMHNEGWHIRPQKVCLIALSKCTLFQSDEVLNSDCPGKPCVYRETVIQSQALEPLRPSNDCFFVSVTSHLLNEDDYDESPCSSSQNVRCFL